MLVTYKTCRKKRPMRPLEWLTLLLILLIKSVYGNNQTTSTSTNSSEYISSYGLTTDTENISSSQTNTTPTLNSSTVSLSTATTRRSGLVSSVSQTAIRPTFTNPTKTTLSTSGTTQSGYLRSSTVSDGKKSSLWSVPLISLVAVCSALVVVCLVCIIIICRLKKSLKRRSKLYPGTMVEEDDHTYMDLGDHPLRAPPPVELKSVTGTTEGETKLTEDDKGSKGLKSYKERKRKPAPPLPQSAVPSKLKINKDDNGREQNTQTTETKRQNSITKAYLPTYNNTVPLDQDEGDENNLYESYDHSLATPESYTNEMIEDALNDITETETLDEMQKEETQRQFSFGSETSNKFRNAQGSFIVSDDAHHEGHAFTERQISNSGLPEVVVLYNTKEPESPLVLQGLQCYENNAFETIEEDIIRAEVEPNQPNFKQRTDLTDGQTIEEDRNCSGIGKTDNLSPGTMLYDDEFIPTTETPEKVDLDNLPLYEDFYERTENKSVNNVDSLPLYEATDDNPTPVTAPFYDDYFVPATSGTEKETIDDLPIYEYAVETEKAEPITNSSLLLNQSTVGNGLLYNDNGIKPGELGEIDDLDVYEDYELSKLPHAPPPPTYCDVHDEIVNGGLNLVENDQMKHIKDNHEIEFDDIKSVCTSENSAVPLVPLRRDLGGQNKTVNDTKHLIQNKICEEKTVLDANSSFAFKDIKSAPDTVYNDSLVLKPEVIPEQIPSENKVDLQHNYVTSKLLDLSLESEKKFRSGSKVDVFDEPSISNSPDAYFLDMNDLPSEIVEDSNNVASPLIDVENPISMVKTNNELIAIDLLSPSLLPEPSSRGKTEHTLPDKFEMTAENHESSVTDANMVMKHPTSNHTDNLLEFGDRNFLKLTPQSSSAIPDLHHSRVQQNGDYKPMTLHDDNDVDDRDIYDIPPPNFPPPELNLN